MKNQYCQQKVKIVEIVHYQCVTVVRWEKLRDFQQKTKLVKIKSDKEGVLKDGDLQPGSTVSTDQYTSSLLGRRTHTRGKESDREKFVGGTIYYDHATQFMYNVNPVSLNANETI